MKIITNKQYNVLKNENKAYKNMYNQSLKTLLSESEYYDKIIEEINDKLKTILNFNSNTSKKTIVEHVKSIVKFIEKGKR